MVNVCGIYSRIFTRIDSLFMAGACTLWFFDNLAYFYGDLSRYAMLRPLRGKRRAAIQRVCRIFRKYKVNISHKPTRILETELCHIKYRRPVSERAGVVHKVNCSDCDAVYLWETGQGSYAWALSINVTLSLKNVCPKFIIV